MGVDGNFDNLLRVLARYVSPVNARVLLMRTLQDEGLEPDRLGADQLKRCGTALRRGIVLFVSPTRREAALRGIAEFCGESPDVPSGCAVEVREEMDIGRVRAEARRICSGCGTSSFVMQRVATIVSELARNMVLYAGGGSLEISVAPDSMRIIVTSKDAGPGIRNLDEVMSGEYKSKTGMGRGLLGTKRLADEFEIDTGPTGTTVIVQVKL
jgi:serine/threonine-protein kinase RsbT